jgi:hypothetical protein
VRAAGLAPKLGAEMYFNKNAPGASVAALLEVCCEPLSRRRRACGALARTRSGPVAGAAQWPRGWRGIVARWWARLRGAGNLRGPRAPLAFVLWPK